MLTDSQLNALTLPIIQIYNEIEFKLLAQVAGRFDVYDKVGGSLEWQAKKLDELGSLTAETVKLLAKQTQRTEKEIVDMLNQASVGNVSMSDLTKAFTRGMIFVDPASIMASAPFRATVELSFKELGQTYKLIQTKALESTKQAYMDIVNRAYIETASGIFDYGSSIRGALRDFADRGITGATYRRPNGKLVRYSIEGAVRRDTVTAVNQLANKGAEKITAEIGAKYVEISAHIGARVSDNPIANHAGWQGKVYKLEGSDEYPNLKESTGYPDDIQGLAGVNCRHRMFPFFPGISTPNPHQIDEAENKKVYEATQKQRAMEREIRSLKKRMIVAKASGDTELAKKYRTKLTEKQQRIEQFCKDNNLRRQTEREMVQEEY